MSEVKICPHSYSVERFYTGTSAYDEKVCQLCGKSQTMPVKKVPPTHKGIYRMSQNRIISHDRT